MTETDQPAQKRRKISLACVQCRERKVRCSGEKPVCASCRRRPGTLSSDCSYAVQGDGSVNVNESIQLLFRRLQRLEDQSALAAAEQGGVSSKTAEFAGDSGTIWKKGGVDGNDVHEGDPGSGSTAAHTSHSTGATQTGDEATDGTFANGENPDLSDPDLRKARQCSTSTFIRPAGRLGQTQTTRSHTSDVNEAGWRPETRLVSQQTGEDTATAADAMGTSSVYGEGSPEESAQYYGGSSGIAFMRAISKVLAGNVEDDAIRVHTSPSTSIFSPGLYKDDGRPLPLGRLPTFEGTKGLPDYFALPPRSISDYLLDCYWTRAYPLYPFLNRPTFEAAYAMLWNNNVSDDGLAPESNAGLGNRVDAGPSTQSFYCALNMMLALGSQFAEMSASHRKDLTTMFEHRSKHLLIVDMMDRGSLAVVQTLLLTGQYFQSTLYPQRCWNSIGVACRIAQGLGLHVEECPRKSDALGLEMRRRVWYGCMLLDMFGSMTMGRPLMISHQYSTALPSLTDDEQLHVAASTAGPPKSFPIVGFFLAAIKLSQTLGIVLTTIYDQSICNTNPCTSLQGTGKVRDGLTPTDLKAMLELDKRLMRFHNELPPELQWGPDGDVLRRSLGQAGGNLSMQTNVLHARFLQTRILLYREPFMQLCQESVFKAQGLHQRDVQTPEFDLDMFYVTRCAISCAASARELLELVHRTSQTKDTDAWWYNVYFTHTSGMVVKLAQLCEPLKQVVSTASLDQSWLLCRDTLLRLTEYAPVAQRCLDSLEAIQEKISSWETKKNTAKMNPPHAGDTRASSTRQPCVAQVRPHPPTPDEALSYHPQNQGHQQFLGPGIDASVAEDRGLRLNDPSITVDGYQDEEYWPTDLRNWWNFPGVDFEFDYLA